MFNRPRLIVYLFALLFAGSAQAASNPWFGVWKLRLEDAGQKPETLVYSYAGPGAMRMASIEDKSVIITHFDGKPAVDVGTGGSHDWALAIKATSATSYSWIFFKNGKPRAQGNNTLAADLRTFKELSWEIGRPEKTMTIIYERQ